MRLGWVAVLRDITHVKRMEELKMQLLVEAAGRMRIPLAQAMNALVELNILTSQNERINEVVNRLTQTWKRVQEWGDDLNALIRLDSGIKVQTTSVDLVAVMKDLRARQTGELGAKEPYRLEFSIEPELPLVMGDPELIYRLLGGLINRSVARTEEGGIVRLSVRSHNGQVWVSVSDDGPQVSDEDLPRIFEKSFVKANPGPGITGLEMALVKTIIDRMGGQVWVGGQDRRGSIIYVCLPTASAA
jgi:signal transduction histidine kinase